MRFRRPPRVPTFSYVGRHRYFLTMCTNARRSLFLQDEIVSVVRVKILQSFRFHDFEVIAYTFMPDHAHFLIEGVSETSDFKRGVTSARRAASLACPSSARPLWQGGYFERVLRNPGGTEAVVNYILNNPVRAGLAKTPLEYPYSWSATIESCGGVGEHAALPLSSAALESTPPYRRER